MKNYIVLVSSLNMFVNLLLLLGIFRLFGSPPLYGKAFAAAFVSGIYAGACLLPDFYFLGNLFWRVVSLVVISAVAFGLNVQAVRKGILFTLFHMAIDGCMAAMGGNSVWSLVSSGIIIMLLCIFGLRWIPEFGKYVPVELQFGEQKVCLTALRDTGNTLRDPITGQSVLVIGADAAERLTGLSREQLNHPVEVIASKLVPGLRLIPYHAIGNNEGMLLAMRLQNVRIGRWRGSSLVAFAPDGLGNNEEYQALTGGMA